MTLSPDALRPWATTLAVNRECRAMLRDDACEPDAVAFLVLLPGAIASEVIPAGAWRIIEGRRVAVVALALVSDGSALTWSTPVTFLPPREPGGGPPVGDA